MGYNQSKLLYLKNRIINFFISLFCFAFYFFPSIFFVLGYFVLFQLILFCFRFVSFRFYFVDFVSFPLVSFRFYFVSHFIGTLRRITIFSSPGQRPCEFCHGQSSVRPLGFHIIFNSSSLKPLNRFQANLPQMFIGWSSIPDQCFWCRSEIQHGCQGQ